MLKLNSILILFLVFITSSCDNNNSCRNKFSVKASLLRSYDSTYEDKIARKTFDIRLALQNVSNDTISYWIMLCSWQQNFLINNNYMQFEGIDCNMNFPVIKKINPNDSLIFNTIISINEKVINAFQGIGLNPRIRSTKFGFLYIDTIRCNRHNNYFDFLEDRSLQDKLYWSNPLYLYDIK